MVVELKLLRELSANHVSTEEILFKDACFQLNKLVEFFDKQTESTYDELKNQCKDLCASLKDHLDRYNKKDE